jgi:hypothetical protein
MNAATFGRDNPAATSMAEIARQHGFSELECFAAVYRDTFGETQPATFTARRSSARDAEAAGIA